MATDLISLGEVSFDKLRFNLTVNNCSFKKKKQKISVEKKITEIFQF